jgi:hypothetical protein
MQLPPLRSRFALLTRDSSRATFAADGGTLLFAALNTHGESVPSRFGGNNRETNMDWLHIILAFNLVTSVGILAACYAMHRSYDADLDVTTSPPMNFAGMSGAALALGLMSGIATLFL